MFDKMKEENNDWEFGIRVPESDFSVFTVSLVLKIILILFTKSNS